MSVTLKELQNSPMSLYMSQNEKRGIAQQKVHLLPQCLEGSLPKGWYHHLPTPHTRQSIINSKGGSSADDSLSMLIRDSIGRPDYRNHLLDLINYWAHRMWLLSHINIQVKEGIRQLEEKNNSLFCLAKDRDRSIVYMCDVHSTDYLHTFLSWGLFLLMSRIFLRHLPLWEKA